MILLPDLVLAVAILIWGGTFFLGRFNLSHKNNVIAGILAHLISMLCLVFTIDGTTVVASDAMVFLPNILLLLRVSLWFTVLILLIQIHGARDIQHLQKPRFALVTLGCLFFLDILLFSNNLALSFVFLILIAFLRQFLFAMNVNGEAAAEGLFKGWILTSLLVMVTICALQFVALKSSGLQFQTISSFMIQKSGASLESLGMVVGITFPFLMLAGIFPFFFFDVDHSQGTTWSALSVSSVLITGGVLTSLWKTILLVFGSFVMGTDLHKVVQALFLFNGFWLVAFCFTQPDPKRFYRSFSLLLWTSAIIAGLEGGTQGIAITTYVLVSSFLWAPVFALAWSAFFDHSQCPNLFLFRGIAKENRSLTVFYFFVLAIPTWFPGFPGFIAVPRQLAVLLRRGEITEFFLLGLLHTLILYLICTMIVRIQFGESSTEVKEFANRDGVMRYGVWGRSVVFLTLFVLLGLGVFGNRSVMLMENIVKNFLN